MQVPSGPLFDPADPRAPTQDVWDAMTPEARAQLVAALPHTMPDHLFMPEGDRHSGMKITTQDVLRRYFGGIGRRVYVSGELNVYYPGERILAPDVIAVLDVETHERDRWVVAPEGRGLDFALEVHHRGDRGKDFWQ